MKKYDALQSWFGADYEINDKLTVHQPRVGEIVDFGEQKYWQLISAITATPSEYKAPLFDKGIDWENVSNFDMFIMFTRLLTVNESSILFGDLDFSKMELAVNQLGEMVLVDPVSGLIIDKPVYHHINTFITKAHGIRKKVDVAGNAFTKKMLIKLNRDDLERAKSDKFNSNLLPLISTLVNYPGFKYDSKTIRDIGVVEFMDAVQRTQIIRQSNAILTGMCSGMVDASKINASSYDCFKEI